MEYVLGIDGGGTKTLAMAVDLHGNVLGNGESSASNYQTVGIDRAVNALRGASEQASAGLTPSLCKVVYMGLAGAGRENDQLLLTQAIAGLIDAEKIEITHDAMIALAGATKCQPGVAVIAGTGAIAFGINRYGEQARAGGWGNILGDEGSAYYIGRRALAASCKAYDGRGKMTGLLEALTEHLKLVDFTEIVRRVYAEGMSPKDIAVIATIVSKLAEDKDEVAVEILWDAGTELALSANTVIKKLRMECESHLVARCGSVFNAGDPLIKTFDRLVKEVAPQAEIIRPKFNPVEGAVLLALREAGIQLDNDVFSKLGKFRNRSCS